jgi:hypothetical protein
MQEATVRVTKYELVDVNTVIDLLSVTHRAHNMSCVAVSLTLRSELLQLVYASDDVCLCVLYEPQCIQAYKRVP